MVAPSATADSGFMLQYGHCRGTRLINLRHGLVSMRHSRRIEMNLNQVTLPATNVERSAEFYRRLGFTQIVANLPSYARFECPEGEATFSLHQVERSMSSETIVYFECDDVDAVYTRLMDRGVVFDHPPQDQSWLWREAYLRDPDGNVICLYRAGTHRRFPPWRI
jgi:catechol 2,3-dioxygenase-like lactoylglutathione lyase family enzyme